MTRSEDRWWRDETTVSHLWHGVFKGGGAKGVAYSGALEATLLEKCWFTAVAGSSAGAITAALVAAGLRPDEIRECSPKLLEGVKLNLLGLILGGSTPVYSMTASTALLRATLRRQYNRFTGEELSASSRVTFKQLFDATNIELNVVVMDLASSQPVVLSVHTTPQCDVSAAVTASSAIPVAFESGRLVMLRKDQPFVVHRVIDGGAWANYPQFVFKDESFRRYQAWPELPENAVVVGFVLDRARSNPEQVPWDVRADLETEELEDSGLFLRNKLFRFLLRRLDKASWRLLTLVFWPILLLLLGAEWIANDASYWEPLRVRIGQWIPFGRILLGTTFIISTVLLGALALTAYALGRQIIRVGIGGVLSALSVTTDVPAWLGTAGGDHVIRVPIPDSLGTRSFKVKVKQINVIIDTAREKTRPQVQNVLAGSPTVLPPTRPHVNELHAPKDEELHPLTHNSLTREALCALVIVGVFGLSMLVSGVAQVMDGLGVPLQPVVIGGLFVLGFIAGASHWVKAADTRRHKRVAEQRRRMAVRTSGASMSAIDPPLTESRCRRRIVGCCLSAILFAVLLAVTLANEAHRFSAETLPATILKREDISSKTFIYTVRLERGAKEGELRTFDSHVKGDEESEVSLRWVGGEQGLDFASQAVRSMCGIVIWFGTPLAILSLCATWGWLDLRWLRTFNAENGFTGDKRPSGEISVDE